MTDHATSLLPTPPAKTIHDLRPGDHWCELYHHDSEHLELLRAFFADGFSQHHKVLYIAETEVAERQFQELAATGLDIAERLRTGQLVTRSPDAAYLVDGRFDMDRMFAVWQSECEAALAAGYAALRAAGEPTWALRQVPGSERLGDYESRLNHFARTHPCIIFCQYDARRFPPGILLDVLRSHPVAVLDSQVVGNPHYVAAGGPYAEEPDVAAQLGRWIAELRTDRRQQPLPARPVSPASPAADAMRRLAGFAGGLALLIAALVLTGYTIGRPFLASLLRDGAQTRPNAAAGLLLLAAALLLLLPRPRGPRRMGAQVAAGVAALVGLLTLGEHLFAWRLPLDDLLFTARVHEWQLQAPGRMSVPAALSLLLLGLALLLLDWEPRPGLRPAPWLGLTVLLIEFAALQGLTYQVAALASFGISINIGLPAALAGTALALAVLLARPEHGLMRVVSSEHAGGLMLRWLLPTAIASIWLFGWLSVRGARLGWYEATFDQVVFSLPLIAVFTLLLARMAGALNQAGELEAAHRAELEAWNRELESRVERRTVDLQLSERRYRSLVTATAQVVWHTDAGGEVTADMPRWREFTGMTVEQIQGWGWIDALHPDDRARTAEIWRAAVRDRACYETEYRLRRADGEYRDVAVRGVPVRESDGSVREWIGTCHDVTDRKRAEESLRKVAHYARNLLEAALDPLVTISRDGKVTDVNAATERATGRPRAQLIGTDFCDYFTAPAEARAGYERVFAEGAVHDYPLAIRSPEGAITEVLYNASLFRDESGAVEGVLAAARDVTARNRAEREVRTLNAELEQRVAKRTAELATANQELEAFTYSVAHDLRTPLRHVHGFVTLLAEEHASRLDDQARGFIAHIVRGTEQMGRLIDDLLNLSRVGRQQLAPQIVGLGRLVDEVRESLAPEAQGRDVAWEIGELPFVECDPALMRQVFHNLLANALKFTRPRAAARIAVTAETRGSETVISVRDNGVGFNMKYADKLFGVFQRLHRTEDFEGTGVGLVTVQRIIHKHGGRIWAEAQLDAGATFFFTLPAASAKHPVPPAPGERRPSSEVPGGQHVTTSC